MLDGKLILIAEDDFLIASGLAEGVSDAGGVTLGPVSTVREALLLIEQQPDGAILDGNLLDGHITPVVGALRVHRIPMVIYTGGSLPDDLRSLLVGVPVLSKPLPCGVIMSAIIQFIQAAYPSTARPYDP